MKIDTLQCEEEDGIERPRVIDFINPPSRLIETVSIRRVEWCQLRDKDLLISNGSPFSDSSEMSSEVYVFFVAGSDRRQGVMMEVVGRILKGLHGEITHCATPYWRITTVLLRLKYCLSSQEIRN